MIPRDYSYRLLHCVYEVYDNLGPGLLESVYEKALSIELEHNGFSVQRQVLVPIVYKGETIDNALRLDLLVDDKVIIELKSVTEYKKLFEKQLYTYLRLLNKELGYVINFNVEDIKCGIHSVANKQCKHTT